jgi:outer membrane protein OmpA-like peptidoglycan-associated protein/opacity protein-like surface antigen
MNKKHLTYYILFILIHLFTNGEIFSQNNTTKQTNRFIDNNFILSLEGGISYGYTDYQNPLLGPAIKASLEYYPLIIDNGRIGIKIFGGGLKLNLEDHRVTTSTNDGLRNIPVKIHTDMIQIGALAAFGYSIADIFIPSISVGAAYLNFSPKDENGTILPFNSQEVYDKNNFAFVIEADTKIKITDRISANLSFNYYLSSTDYLDDISASTNDDSFITLLAGLSYAFTGNFDTDNDGIIDKYDLCPDKAEDFDGFEDEDGCPDKDNDKDGILDIDDKCPNDAEDFDGFEDYDGCPDLDNDKDGILDINDKCPDQAEDFDGFEDEDGCPDPDNDKDGILDINDKCPDVAENFNGFEDQDGCPDEDTRQETFYQFVLRGDDTFASNSANLKDAAKLVLNEIIFYIQNQPAGSKWRIEGHMDSQGAAASIKKTSYDRAKAVYDYMISKGISQDQLEIYGLGDSFPIANNNSPEGRSTNRRIMIIRED